MPPRDETNNPALSDMPELSVVAGELRAVGAAQTALAETLVVDLTSAAMTQGLDPTVLSRLQSFDRLAQEVEELAVVLDRLAEGVAVDDAIRVKLGDLADRLESRLRLDGPCVSRRTHAESSVELF